MPLSREGKAPDIRTYLLDDLLPRLEALERSASDLVAPPSKASLMTASNSYEAPTNGKRVKKISDICYVIDGYTKMVDNFTDEDWALVQSESGESKPAEVTPEEAHEEA